jgi:hypothetical protein
MITFEFLQGKPDETYPVKQPQAYQRDGWYATSYKIAWSDALVNTPLHLQGCNENKGNSYLNQTCQ